ncbi:MAG: hypothetical protein ACRDSR_15455 [Pseudonocardiaceae bacterium]
MATLPIQRGLEATTPIPRVDASLRLSARALAWLAEHPVARAVVDSVWDTLAELENAGHHAGALAALRFVLVHHEPNAAGRCRACRRVGWRGLWRRHRFPCVVWRQIRGELRGHLAVVGFHRRADDSRTARRQAPGSTAQS